MENGTVSEHGTWSECTRPDRRAAPRSVSIDRPTWVAMVKFCQLLNPADFVHLNHALAIGSVIPALPIDTSRVEILNKMIELVWGEDLVLIIPMVVTSSEIGNQRMPNGVTPPKTPVNGLNVRTQQVTVNEGDVLERVIGKTKSDYKYLGPTECMESGCELVLSSILGNLITQPSKSAMPDTRPDEAISSGHQRTTSRPASVRSSRHHRRSSSKHRHGSSNKLSDLGSRTQKDYMEGNLWQKIRKAMTD